MLERTRDEGFNLLLARYVTGDDHRLAAAALDACGHGLAGVGLAAGDDDLGTKRGHDFSRRAADALARSRYDGNLPGQIERILHGLQALPVVS
jgi:hypothetical protein